MAGDRLGFPGRFLSWLVRAIDRRMRQRIDIWEFNQDPACILRVGTATARIGAQLADGTIIKPGDTIGVIHLWNERMPQIPAEGPTLAWARQFRGGLFGSFRLLADYVAESPRLAHIPAFGGELPFVFTPATTRMLERLGLEIFDDVPPRGLGERAIDLGSRIWTWLMRWAFNPGSARETRLSDLTRRPAWISRNTLLTLCTGCDPDDPPPQPPKESEV